VIYPLAYLVTTSSLTLLLIFVGVFAQPASAADLALAQGAVLATFYAFSANVRNLVLQRHEGTDADRIMLARLLFLPPLCALAYFLSVHVAALPVALAAPVIARRACEWLGEVHLSRSELARRRGAVIVSLAAQSVTLAAVVLAFVVAPQFTGPALWIWALAPLIGAAPHNLRASMRGLGATLRMLMPHIGSTMIIGISIYLLRLIVVQITERPNAGILFTGIAIGSFAGSLFANVLGPSLALRRSTEEHPRLLRPVLIGFTLVGFALAFASPFLSRLPLGQPTFFWATVGLSLVGSAIMIEAQRVRLGLFAASRGDELFGPDVLRTLTLMVAAPVIAFLLGIRWLAALYFVDAILTWVFYQGAARHAGDEGTLSPAIERWVRAGVAVLLVLPLFLQLSGGIYSSPDAPMLDSGGLITKLPLPVSIAACFAGIVLLARFRQARISLALIFLLFVSMTLTSVIVSQGAIDLGSRKLLLLAQVLLPVFALVLGEMFESDPASEHQLARIFLYTLAVFVPLQLAATWLQGKHLLTHDLFLFSVYQHRQYVPVVFVAAYLVALFTLWESRRERPLLIGLGTLMGVYVAISYSTLALGLLVLGAALLTWRLQRGAARLAVTAVVVASLAATLWAVRHTQEFREKYSLDFARTIPGTAVPMPENVSSRARDWTLYGRGVLESGETLLFGHRQALDRSVSTSAHNYYLDFAYNFGVVGFLPLAALIAYTVWLLLRERRRVWADLGTCGLAAIILFLIFVDNNFKVNFRQPYPGIFSFFLWGLLLARLSRRRAEA
jgi:hypothetical protein